MKEKSSPMTLIYGIVLVVLILFGLSILFIYYTQPFKESYDFVEKLDYGDISFQSNKDYQNVEVLYSASADIGKVKLKNDGYFGKIYAAPKLIGCLDVTDKNSQVYQNRQVSISISETKSSSGLETRYYGNNNGIEIASGDNKELFIAVRYSGYNTPMDQFSRANIRGLKVYQLKTVEENPINVQEKYYDSYYNRYYPTCDSLESSDEEPLEEISIN